MSNNRTVRNKSKSKTTKHKKNNQTGKNDNSNNNNDHNRDDDAATTIHYVGFLLSLCVLGFAIYSKYHTSKIRTTTGRTMADDDSFSSRSSPFASSMELDSSIFSSNDASNAQRRKIWQQQDQYQEKDNDEQQQQEDPSLECSIFVAPSTVPGGGWGMFAAKSFEKDEVIEIAPFYVPLPPQSPVIYNSILKDYIYGYYHRKIPYNQQLRPIPLASVSLGYIMVANHHSKPNIQSYFYGQEPPLPQTSSKQQSQQKGSAASHGFISLRDIQAGEELFSSYSADGSDDWFVERGLVMNTPNPTNDNDSHADNVSIIPNLNAAKQRYCPKLYGGIGQPTLLERMMTPSSTMEGKEVKQHPYYHKALFPPVDAGWGNVMARENVKEGDIIESVPALILTRHQTNGTALAPLIIGWNDLSTELQITLQQIRQGDGNALFTQYQDTTTQKRIDNWKGFDNIAILPLGSIGIVRRIVVPKEQANNPKSDDNGSDTINCHLQIRSSLSDHDSNLSTSDITTTTTTRRRITSHTENGNAGIVVDLVASQSIKVGDILQVNLPMTGTPQERMLLLEQIQQTGQPLPPLDMVQDILVSSEAATVDSVSSVQPSKPQHVDL